MAAMFSQGSAFTTSQRSTRTPSASASAIPLPSAQSALTLDTISTLCRASTRHSTSSPSVRHSEEFPVALFISSDRTPRPDGSRRTGRRHLLKAATWIAAVIIVPILIGFAIVLFLINTGRGHAYLVNLIQNQAAEALGVGVHLENFSLHLSNLSVDLYGLRVD